MVPEGSRPRISGVLAAVDFSLPSAHALSLANCSIRGFAAVKGRASADVALDSPP